MRTLLLLLQRICIHTYTLGLHNIRALSKKVYLHLHIHIPTIPTPFHIIPCTSPRGLENDRVEIRNSWQAISSSPQLTRSYKFFITLWINFHRNEHISVAVVRSVRRVSIPYYYTLFSWTLWFPFYLKSNTVTKWTSGLGSSSLMHKITYKIQSIHQKSDFLSYYYIMGISM